MKAKTIGKNAHINSRITSIVGYEHDAAMGAERNESYRKDSEAARETYEGLPIYNKYK